MNKNPKDLQLSREHVRLVLDTTKITFHNELRLLKPKLQ